jgi:hypothetical protein
MSHPVTVELSDAAYSALEKCALAVSRTPAELATATLEQRFSTTKELLSGTPPLTEAERKVARERFERHFGAVNLGYATGSDNESIDADLAQSYDNVGLHPTI